MISSKMLFSLRLKIRNFLSRFSLSIDMKKETPHVLNSSFNRICLCLDFFWHLPT